MPANGNKILKAWMRDLQVILTSDTMKNSIAFGQEWKKGKDDINIEVRGTKYLSAMKDSFTIRITNLTYSELVQLIIGKYYGIEIKAGYRNRGAQTIFKGAVIYMSYEKQDITTNTVIILAGSKMVAAYGQSRMNLSLNSGINMYSALKFICRRAGITNANIDEDLKNRVIRDATSSQGTVGSWLESFSTVNNFIVDSDSSYGNDATIISPYRTNNRVIKLDSNKITLVSGYPKLNSDGLSLTILPTFNFMPMDVIVIDNSIIDISVDSSNSKQFNNSMYLDEDGKYLITQIEYDLQNRGDSFNVHILAKARSLYSQFAGVEGYK